ncbi:MAG: response regulator, partial [Candidatus Cloacimonetes bacterium]|nr:response regulator [Candidatus Cloacimonadota bacterium]
SQRKDTTQTTGYDLPTALILDEEDALGNLMIKIVSNMGLQVMKTSDPHELKSLYEKAIGQGRKVNLLLADLNIPSDIDVKPLVLNFKDTNPDIKVIAYSDQIQPNDLNVYQQQGFDDILAKPFNINDLEALIKRNSAQ